MLWRRLQVARQPTSIAMNGEKKRLIEDQKRIKYWKRFGPYLAERQWGTVREDCSKDNRSWEAFPYEMARSRAYRWGEDGIAGLSDTHARLCFSLSFWNGVDPFLKERLFGVNNREGNHGEDVKEYYYYLDNTPTHSYMKYLYKYPHAEYPYGTIRGVNEGRSQAQGEYELIDTGIFDHNRYCDIFIEYAKKAPEEIAICITIHNRGNEPIKLDVLPTLWARNDWFNKGVQKPVLKEHKARCIVEAVHPRVGHFFLHGEEAARLLFTENESKGHGRYSKDGIDEYLVHRNQQAINPDNRGTKVAFHYALHLPAFGSQCIHMRLSKVSRIRRLVPANRRIFKRCMRAADAFYKEIIPASVTKEHRAIARQAYAGMLWNKMYYNLEMIQWLAGQREFFPPLPAKDPQTARNGDWLHLHADDVVSTPDKWEFNMFFAWDTAFHAIPLATIDAEYAKHQMVLLTQEWYMHPSGMLPAYEWNFYDVNPPVHAWGTWRVYQIEKKYQGKGDRVFLERVFHKLLLNFTWWVNRKDSAGKNIFQGGFLGLDNISLFNRSTDLPPQACLYQSDATSWMGMFCLNMLTISLELAKENVVYEDMANKFYNHYLLIADAINFFKQGSPVLWDEKDGFYYDILTTSDGKETPLKVRSLVGLMPILAISTIDFATLKRCPVFKRKNGMVYQQSLRSLRSDRLHASPWSG